MVLRSLAIGHAAISFHKTSTRQSSIEMSHFGAEIKGHSHNIIFGGGCGKNKKLIRGLFRVLIRRSVFLETFRTKCPLSLEESSEEMSPAENSPALPARRAT